MHQLVPCNAQAQNKIELYQMRLTLKFISTGRRNQQLKHVYHVGHCELGLSNSCIHSHTTAATNNSGKSNTTIYFSVLSCCPRDKPMGTAQCLCCHSTNSISALRIKQYSLSHHSIQPVRKKEQSKKRIQLRQTLTICQNSLFLKLTEARIFRKSVNVWQSDVVFPF